MAGSQQYKNIEIHYVLKAIHMRMPSEWIRKKFSERFRRNLSENQLRYLKNKYGRDPRFGTPAANSTSTFGAPNPRVGPNYWPNDDILNIDYQAFEERRADAAEPMLRVTPVNGTVAPNPTPVAHHAPVPQAKGPDSFELRQAIDAHTTSMSGQKRMHDTDDEDEVDGLIESPLPRLTKVSRVNAPQGYENNVVQQEYSAAIQGGSAMYTEGPMMSTGTAFRPSGPSPVGPVPPAPAPVPRPPPINMSGPAQNYAGIQQGPQMVMNLPQVAMNPPQYNQFNTVGHALQMPMNPPQYGQFNPVGQVPQMPMNNHQFTPFNPVGQGMGNTMQATVPIYQQNATSAFTGHFGHSTPNNMNVMPLCQPGSNGFIGQNVSNGMNLASAGHQSGANVVYNNGFNQGPAMPNTWQVHNGMGNTSMNLLNTTPDFIGFNNTPQTGGQTFMFNDGRANQATLTPISHNGQAPNAFTAVNNAFSHVAEWDWDSLPAKNTFPLVGNPVFDNRRSETPPEMRRDREWFYATAEANAAARGQTWFHLPSDTPEPIFSVARNETIATANAATAVATPETNSASSFGDEEYETDSSGSGSVSVRAATVESGSTDETPAVELDQLDQLGHYGMSGNEDWPKQDLTDELLNAHAAYGILNLPGGPDEV